MPLTPARSRPPASAAASSSPRARGEQPRRAARAPSALRVARPTLELVAHPAPSRRAGRRRRAGAGARRRARGVRADRRVAAGAERARRARAPRARHACGVGSCERRQRGARRRSSPARASSASAPWPGRRHERSRSSSAPASSAAPEPLEAGARRARARRTRPSASLRSRVSTLPRSSTHLEVRPRGEQLRARGAGCSVPTRAPGGQRRRATRAPHERVARRRRAPAPPTIARPSGQLARHVLGRVHGEVDLAAQQRVLELAPTQRDLSSPARAPRSPAVVIVTSSRLARAALGHPARLGQRQRAAARAEPISRPRRRSSRTSARGRVVAGLVGRLGDVLEAEQLAQQRCMRACTRSPPRPLQPQRRLVQQPVDHRARERLDPLAVALGERLPAALVLGQHAARRSRRRGARSAASVGSTSSEPSQSAKPGSPPRRWPRRCAASACAHAAVARDHRLEVVDVEQRDARRARRTPGRCRAARRGRSAAAAARRAPP